MFSHNMRDSSTDQVELPSVEPEGFEPLLQYAYTGELPLTLHNVHAILPVAAFLQITPALTVIAQFLKSKMTFDNAQQLVSLGEDYGLSELKLHYRQMILKDFTDFCGTETFLALDAMSLSGYLMEDSLCVPSEKVLLDSVLRWYNHDCPNREEHIPEVLDKVRYTLDGWPTIEYAENEKPFTTNKQCREILRWCMRYMQNPCAKIVHQSYRTRVRYHRKSLIQMGGLRLERAEPILGFELPDEDEPGEERTGYMLNHYFHHLMQSWLPMGTIAMGDSRSHCPLVEVNDFAVMVGGYLYTSDFNLGRFQHCSNEVKLVQPAGCFALWDMPYLQEARAHHVAVFCKG